METKLFRLKHNLYGSSTNKVATAKSFKLHQICCGFHVTVQENYFAFNTTAMAATQPPKLYHNPCGFNITIQANNEERINYYHAIIEPHLDNCGPVRTASPDGWKQKLGVPQRNAVWSILDHWVTTNIPQLMNELKIHTVVAVRQRRRTQEEIWLSKIISWYPHSYLHDNPHRLDI